jgi:hypothetical protein
MYHVILLISFFFDTFNFLYLQPHAQPHKFKLQGTYVYIPTEWLLTLRLVHV